jgi:pimeloyl-ACP methyl ester carboxylesterase
MSYFWRPMKTQAGRKAFLHFAHCLNNRDLTDISEQLKQLSIPVLIIRGAKDVYLSKEIANKLHKNITTSRLITIDTAGHFLQEDEPELIVHHLNAFIHSE